MNDPPPQNTTSTVFIGTTKETTPLMPNLLPLSDKGMDKEHKGMVDKRQDNLVEVMDGFLEEVTKSTNFYRDIANNHNKRNFLRKKVVTLV